MDVDMGNASRSEFTSISDVTSVTWHEEIRIASAHEEPWSAHDVRIPLKIGELAMGTTMMFLGGTKFASILES